MLGDFNIDRRGDANYQALISTGLATPPQLDAVARTVSSKEGADGTFYDQIAWFPKKLRLRYTGRAGRVNWKGKVLTDIDPTEVTFRISDHYPLWVEFAVSDTPPSDPRSFRKALAVGAATGPARQRRARLARSTGARRANAG